MKKKSNKKLVLLLILVLVISVGYAALATTIKINGTSTVKGLNWNIYWDNVVPTEGSVTGANVTTAPTTNGTSTTTVTFGVILPEPGDFYEFTVDAVNAGSIDAMIADDGILYKAYSDSGYTQEVTLPDVVRYTVTDSEGNEIEEGRPLLKKSGNTPTRDTYKVRVEYRNDSEINPSDLDGTNDREYYFKFEVTYVQKTGTDNNESTPSQSNVSIVSGEKGNLQPGNIVKIGDTEEFFVISSDNSENGKTKLFAKYNLLVGYIIESYSKTGSISDDTPGYGLQSEEATAQTEYGDTFKGSIEFANYNMTYPYWMNSDGTLLLDDYTNDNTIYYDQDSGHFKNRSDNSIAHPYIYNENSVIYDYISGENGYVNKLISMGAPSTITGRLLTFDEAEAIKNIGYNGKSIVFGEQSYWLGTADSSIHVDAIPSHENGVSVPVGDMEPSTNEVNYDSQDGIRPVIEIFTKDIH